jgi:phosphopantothenoylcysteine decarboxylase/phosphopantothenate--cysteine ligase
MTVRPDGPRVPWEGRRVVLGVSGGIAAYKVVQVARDLTLLGCTVDVVLTRAAGEFVRPLSFEGVTGRPCHTDLFSADGAALHIRLGREADVVCVAPTTADLLARLSQGRSDDLLTTTILATRAPVVLCPAMNDHMWAHAQVRENAERCRALGYQIVGPADGRLAVGEAEGPGRLVEPDEIVARVGRALGKDGPLKGRRVVVTAGPTREAVDPVRYLGNRSSGRMGYALAEAAWLAGAEVTLVSGPSDLADPVGVQTLRVESAVEMLEAVRAPVAVADVTIYAAAVADFRPVDAAPEKIKRGSTGPRLDLELTANPDIARETRALRQPASVAVGFALETDDLMAGAYAKLEAKGFDLLVANDARDPEAGFEVETNRVTLVQAGVPDEALPLLSKRVVADRVIARVVALLGDEARSA